MLFSDVFKVDKDVIEEYGAVNINLLNDTPLFIDPLLIYANKDPLIKQQYDKIVRYLLYLNNKSRENLNEKAIIYYYSFNEVKKNWLGMSKNGNQGKALGKVFAKELHSNIQFVCDTSNVSDKIHVEKMYLFKDGVGRDKISDWVMNVLLSFFVEYTEIFAKKYIDAKYCKKVFVQRGLFNYKTGLFEEVEAYLPVFKNFATNEEDYVLLTPKSILRKEELAINHTNFMNDLDDIRNCIDNDELKFQVNTIVRASVDELYKKKSLNEETISQTEIKKAKGDGLISAVREHPVIYDYYIKNKEDYSDLTIERAQKETDKLLSSTITNEIINKDVLDYHNIIEFNNAFDEAVYRINFLKNEIEVNGAWKNLYYEGQPISDESNLQNLFKVVWCRSKYLFSPEANAGVGPIDFIIGLDSVNKCLIEFKLARNSKLSNVYKQVDEYKKSHRAKKVIIVIFYFSDSELKRATKVLNNNPDKENNLVILVDCMKETKKSASKS